jgi:hypothetical protein
MIDTFNSQGFRLSYKTGLTLMNFEQVARNFITNYEGPQLAICAVGIGSHLNALTLYPGAAKCIYTIHAPYAVEAVKEFIESAGVRYPSEAKSVSLEMLDALDEALKNKYPNCTRVTMTGAVISQRYRRGLDHAYVAINGKTIYFELEKCSEEQHALLSSKPELLELYRSNQDDTVSAYCLSALCWYAGCQLNSSYIRKQDACYRPSQIDLREPTGRSK